MPSKAKVVKGKPKGHKPPAAKPRAVAGLAVPAPRPRAQVAERLQAADAFIRSGRSLAEIAKAHTRSWATIQSWCKDEAWEDRRREFLLSDSGQADILGGKVREMLVKLQEGQSALTGPMANTILIAKRAEREIRGDRYNFTQLVSVIQTFLRHLRAADPSLLPLLEPHVEAFLQAQKESMLPRGR